MTRLHWTRRLLSLALVSVMPLGVLAPACSSSSNTSTRGQRITCTVTASGMTNCRPSETTGSSGSGSNTCEDIDEDGDGTPHDIDDDGQTMHGSTSGSATDDDDDDGIENEHDCDNRDGGDDDHDGSGDDDGSDDDDGGHDGSGSGTGIH